MKCEVSASVSAHTCGLTLQLRNAVTTDSTITIMSYMQDVPTNAQCLLSKYVVTDCLCLCHGARRIRLAGVEG